MVICTGLRKNKKVNTKRPIRFSTWTLRHKKNKRDVRVAVKVIVEAKEQDIFFIKDNSLYLGRVYREIFGRDKFLKKRQENMYEVIDIELDQDIIGERTFAEYLDEKNKVRQQED